jgi:chaperonin GroES
MAKNSNVPSIKPLHDYVLIRPVGQEEKTASGIILPETVKKESQIGEVMAVGPGKFDEDGEKLIPMSVKVGQKVLYKKWGGSEVEVNREEWKLVEQNDVIAIVE